MVGTDDVVFHFWHGVEVLWFVDFTDCTFFFLFVYSTYCAITVLFIRWDMHSPVLCEQTDTLVNEWLAG